MRQNHNWSRGLQVGEQPKTRPADYGNELAPPKGYQPSPAELRLLDTQHEATTHDVAASDDTSILPEDITYPIVLHPETGVRMNLANRTAVLGVKGVETVVRVVSEEDSPQSTLSRLVGDGELTYSA